MSKTNPGRFFEDFRLGELIRHAVPRTVSGGERALYHALYPARAAIHSSDPFAQSLGLRAAPLDQLAAFHLVFGKTVPDISLNAVANLGYAEGRFHRFVYPGDTLQAESEVIGLKQNSNGKTGVVWVHTRGSDQNGQLVLEFKRWVMLRKRTPGSNAPAAVIPDLAPAVAPNALVLPEGLDFDRFDTGLSGEPHRLGDYSIGEVIDHVDGVTLEEAEHMLATRLWQNTAKVHFDASLRSDGLRLIYGGHIISMAQALSFNGLANAAPLLAINGGTHRAPAFAGDTVYARSEVLDHAELARGVGALRLRLTASTEAGAPGRQSDGEPHPSCLLEFDVWLAIPV